MHSPRPPRCGSWTATRPTCSTFGSHVNETRPERGAFSLCTFQYAPFQLPLGLSEDPEAFRRCVRRGAADPSAPHTHGVLSEPRGLGGGKNSLPSRADNEARRESAHRHACPAEAR